MTNDRNSNSESISRNKVLMKGMKGAQSCQSWTESFNLANRQVAANNLPVSDLIPNYFLSLIIRRRLGMGKQWSMDETKSWFR